MNELKSLTLNGKKYDCFVDSVARENSSRPFDPVEKIDVLDTDPTGEDLTEGRIWILKTTTEKLTTPVIELGTVGEDSIAIKLSNASFDGSGAVVETYRVYVNGSYVKSETIVAGGICTVSGLVKGTKYQISVRGVNGNAISAWSNTLSATTAGEPVVPDEPDVPDDGTPKIVYLLGGVGEDNGDIVTKGYKARAAAVYNTGEKAIVNNYDANTYYPIPVPADATSCTVVCPGFMFGYNGWNLTDGAYTYDVDSGWKNSGATYKFNAGAAEYATIGIKKTDDSTITMEDLVNINITIA